MVTSGFLLKTGQFSFWPLYFSLLTGDFTADIGWYAVGRYGARTSLDRIYSFFHLTPDTLLMIEERFKKYQDAILFISKITMGFGFSLATLIVAGLLKVSFKRYVVLNLLGGFIWTGFLVSVGFFLGNIYNSIDRSFKLAFIVLLILGLIFMFKTINNYLMKKKI